MLFSGIAFVYYFLPFVLIIYYIIPRELKNAFLLCASLFFYFWGEPVYTLLMLFSIGTNFILGGMIYKSGLENTRRRCLAASVLLCLLMLGFFKYADFAVGIVNSVFNLSLKLPNIPLPLGISFYTFQIMSYTVDVYRKDAKAEKSPLSFAAYVSFFPQLVAGPIVRYRTIADELQNRVHSYSDFTAGFTRFVIGLSKKVLIANRMGLLRDASMAPAENSVVLAWLGVIAFSFQVYFDFSGYSDMAIGMGRMFGFHFLENFNYPFISKSVSEFWRRWHISLGTWFREYLYIPLGGNRCSRLKWLRNLFIVWFCTGLWHGASFNFVLWGLYFGFILCAERLLPERFTKYIPNAVKHIVTLFLIIVSFVVFHNDTLPDAARQFYAMFGVIKLPVVNAETLYLLKGAAVMLTLSVIGSTPAPKRVYEAFTLRYGTASKALTLVFTLILLLISTAYLADSSYNPFLYFRF